MARKKSVGTRTKVRKLLTRGGCQKCSSSYKNASHQLYLDNDYCSFIPLDKLNLKKKKDLFVTSLFKMGSGGYKSFTRYLEGLKILNKLAEENNMEVRLFIDQTIYSDKQIMKMLRKLNRTKLVLYTCKDFLVGKNHVGLFGTMVRFFPLFDFPNNDARTVFITDADVTLKDLKYNQFTIRDEIQKRNLQDSIKVGFRGNYFHSISVTKQTTLPYCIASNLVGFTRLDVDPLYDYLKTLETYMHDDTRPTKILSDYGIKKADYKRKCENNICFGVDEYFINDVLFKYLMKRKQPMCYFVSFNIPNFNYYLHPGSPDVQKTATGEYIKQYSQAMKTVHLDGYSFEQLDGLIYRSEMTDFMEDYAKKIISLILGQKFIFNKYHLHVLTDVDYTKYYFVDYIRFKNTKLPDIYMDALTYSKDTQEELKEL